MILVSRICPRSARLLLLAAFWLPVPLLSHQQQQQQQTHLSPVDWTADQSYSPLSAPLQPISPPAPSDHSDPPPAPVPPTPTLPPPLPPANNSLPAAPCPPEEAPGAQPTAFHLPKFFPVDMRAVDERAFAADPAHRAYERQRQIAERPAHRLQPRQVYVVASTTYPGTDTIYATKTVFVNGPQQSPDSHPVVAGAAVTVIVNPALATPSVVYGNGPGRGPNTTPNGNPNVVVATVTVLSSANRVVWDEFRKSGWPMALVMNMAICMCVSVGIGVVHLGGL